MERDHSATSLEDIESLKKRLEDQIEELAASKKVLKEEIFKRWRAEEALRESEEKNKRLLESFEDGYFEVDLAGNLTFFNESLCRMMGYSQREMMGMNNRQYMSPETSRKVYETFNKVFLTGKATKAFGWELLRKDGQVRHVETSVSPVHGPDGDKIGFRGIARDVTERRLVEKDLEESEQKYRTILESIEDGYYEVDLEGNLIFFNPALCKITGYSSEELQGMNNREYTEPETAKKMFEIFNRVYRTGEPSKINDYEVIKKDGSRAVVELSTALTRNAVGEALGFRGIARDVTERERIKRELKESEEKYRTILQSIEDGYCEVNIRGDFVFFNESMARILGYAPGELMGMNNRHYMTEETAKEVYRLTNEVYRTGIPTKSFDWEVIRKDGEKRYLETSVSILRDSKSNTIGFRGIARDVTERRITRKAIEESEKKYRTILESIEDGYFEVDIKGNFTFFNESMCRILGYPEQELKGMNNRQFMSEETSKRVFQTFNHVYQIGEPTKALGWELIRKDGEIRYVETSVSLIRNPKGEPVGFRGIARDITGVRRLEKAKERAINHLSHELGTPLSVMEAALKRIPDLIKSKNTERIYEWIERMKRNLKRLKDLQGEMDDILKEKPVLEKERIINFVEAAIALLDEMKDEPLEKGAEVIRQNIIKRLDSLHKVEGPRKENIVLDAFIHQVCEEGRQSMRGRQLDIVEKVERGASVEMDAAVLKKVCEGFLKNAIENTPDGGRIEIGLTAKEGVARLDFHDFGIGITPENQKLIFSGFFHTQDTHQYASRKPYMFNAGGAGCDLLRARVFSERFGFSVDFSTTRCRYLPSDKDECPGGISLCPFIRGREDCLTSGGSTFSLQLPLRE
jgi:PAS domain S-box-containing protein